MLASNPAHTKKTARNWRLETVSCLHHRVFEVLENYGGLLVDRRDRASEFSEGRFESTAHGMVREGLTRSLHHFSLRFHAIVPASNALSRRLSGLHRESNLTCTEGKQTLPDKRALHPIAFSFGAVVFLFSALT